MESVEIACHCVARMGQCCFPIGHEAMLADIFGCHIWEEGAVVVWGTTVVQYTTARRTKRSCGD